ncbi:unnamed protein product [Calypogeia fissa]
MPCDLVVDSFLEHMSKTSLEFLGIGTRVTTKSGFGMQIPRRHPAEHHSTTQAQGISMQIPPIQIPL